VTAVLCARDVGYRPVDRLVLDGVSVEARAGEILAVTGPSGSGKSSLLALMAGLAVPTAGEVLLDGVALPPGTDTGFGLVLQGYGLVHVLTAAENVEVVLQARRVRRSRTRSRAAAALAEVGLAEVADRPVEELSGGQRQRVAVARALVVHPRVVLADEPTAQQDAATKATILALLRRAADGGAVVVLATHDAEVVQRCDRELALHDGRVVLPVPLGATGGAPGLDR
jgi:ABC-type lipoprotein export system ATPase subunit